MRLLTSLFLLLFLSTAGLAQTTLVPVTFIVTDFDTDKEIVGALVTVRQTALTQPTISGGKVRFENVPVGEIEYFIVKEGYQFTTGRENVSTDTKTNVFRVPMSKIDDKKILVTGEVTDSEGRDLADALVEIKLADQIKTVKTDDGGNYSAEVTPSAKYTTVNSLRIEVKKGDCKKTETVDIPRTNVVYKDLKLECGVKDQQATDRDRGAQPTNRTQQSKVLARKNNQDVEVRITGFEQNSTEFRILFELQNNSTSDPRKNFPLYNQYARLQDQDGNFFISKNIKVGNVLNSVVTLVQGNTSKGYAEFEVGNQVISKLNFFSIIINQEVEFYNVQLK